MNVLTNISQNSWKKLKNMKVGKKMTKRKTVNIKKRRKEKINYSRKYYKLKNKEEKKNFEISGSEKIIEKVRKKTPWIGGSFLRKPIIKFPKIKLGNININPISNVRSFIFLIVMIATFLLQIGIPYLILRTPPAIGSIDNRPAFVYWGGVNAAFILESIIGSTISMFASLGFFMFYRAHLFIGEKKIKQIYFIFGIILIIGCFGMLQYILGIKLGIIPP